MNDILSTLSQFSPMATIALALFIIWQLIRNRKQMNAFGTNHITHLEDSLKSHIDMHERREMEQGRQVLEMLGRIERAVIEQGSRQK